MNPLSPGYATRTSLYDIGASRCECTQSIGNGGGRGTQVPEMALEMQAVSIMGGWRPVTQRRAVQGLGNPGGAAAACRATWSLSRPRKIPKDRLGTVMGHDWCPILLQVEIRRMVGHHYMIEVQKPVRKSVFPIQSGKITNFGENLAV